ncbi:ATP-binding protein [Streptantibioticus rubrisoli]|uniref:ATP-binding protein n=1 Tax=Streptantibioticus rubrisoli TaxID=1387313 RepID=A0ABT1PEM3_9ACTN|nr:ATP-binding protein [Streptantibioticus rubrisoli]MCQ4043807.1 ATP-binding protein [Streptantibioticus rubrisoli]
MTQLLPTDPRRVRDARLHTTRRSPQRRRFTPVTGGLCPGGCRRQALLTLPAQEAHVSAARHFTADLLESWSIPQDERDSAILIVDELAANAARYGHEYMTLQLALDHHTLHIVVVDSGADVDRPRQDIAPDEHGRGNGIVEFLAQSTEVHQAPDGREVHACLQCSA